MAGSGSDILGLAGMLAGTAVGGPVGGSLGGMIGDSALAGSGQEMPGDTSTATATGSTGSVVFSPTSSVGWIIGGVIGLIVLAKLWKGK